MVVFSTYSVAAMISHSVLVQLMLRSETRYFPKGTIIADSSEDSKGLMVITSGQVDSEWL